MESESQVTQLEQALLRQAESLAEEHVKAAESARARIQAETEERISLRTEREVAAAKAEAERLIRRRLQAAETRLAADLDRLRWALTEAALAQVKPVLHGLVRDDARYRDFLVATLTEAAAQLPPGDLVVEADSAELRLLESGWAEIVKKSAPGRSMSLVAVDRSAQGGINIRLADNRARLDQTFEARQARLADEMARRTMERLFASTPDLGALVHG